MNLNQIKLPIPKRTPKLVTPKTPAPWDVTEAIKMVEHDAYNALIKEPAEAAGITPPPELPGPGTLVSMLLAPLQGAIGGLVKGQGAQRGEIKEEKAPPAGGVATRGSL